MSRKDTFPNFPLFQRAFSSLFSNDVKTFKFELFHNMNNLEKQLNKETLHEQNSKSDLSVIKVQFDKFLHSKELKPSNYDGCHVRENFKDYTQMEAQSFKDLIIQQMDSIEQSIIERALHQQEIQKRLTRLNDRKLQIQECKVQEVKALNASLGDTDSSGIVSKKEAILGMIRISDLPMTQNQWLRYHILLNIICLLLKLKILSNLNFLMTHP
ncbi:hypothetical protein Tco_1138676 [Tanacetum coccineum]